MSVAEEKFKENIAHQRLVDFVEWLLDVKLKLSWRKLWAEFEEYDNKR